jgi:hypothetical protein
VDSLDAEEQTTMHDALYHVLTSVAASGAHLRQHCEVAGTAEGAGVIPASLPPHPSRLPSDRVLSERGNESEP